MTECIRCNGQMVMESDMHGKYWNCVQCGININITTIDAAPQNTAISGKHSDAILHLPSKNFMSGTIL